MTLIGCFVPPHPPIIVPEVGGASLAEADATVRAMRLVRKRAALLDPDTIVLLSPHSAPARLLGAAPRPAGDGGRPGARRSHLGRSVGSRYPVDPHRIARRRGRPRSWGDGPFVVPGRGADAALSPRAPC